MVQGGLQILKSEAELKSEGRKQTAFAKLLSGGKRGTKMPISFNSVYFPISWKYIFIECTVKGLINQTLFSPYLIELNCISLATTYKITSWKLLWRSSWQWLTDWHTLILINYVYQWIKRLHNYSGSKFMDWSYHILEVHFWWILSHAKIQIKQSNTLLHISHLKIIFLHLGVKNLRVQFETLFGRLQDM
mgnify:CR=1 FL=1